MAVHALSNPVASVVIEPAVEGHIPGIGRQGLAHARCRQHHQGRHPAPTGIGAQSVIPTAAITETDPRTIDGQARHQHQGHVLMLQRRRRSWRCRHAAIVGLQGQSGLPRPITEPAIGHGGQRQGPRQTLQPGPQVGLIDQGPAQTHMAPGRQRRAPARQQVGEVGRSQSIQPLLQGRSMLAPQVPKTGAQPLFAQR